MVGASASAGGAQRLLGHLDDVAHLRIDARLPALAAEDAVVADARLDVVALQIGPHAAAQVLRREGLADGADVVALALDGKERHAADRLRLDLSGAHRKL